MYVLVEEEILTSSSLRKFLNLPLEAIELLVIALDSDVSVRNKHACKHYDRVQLENFK